MSGHVTNPSYFISFVKRGDREKAHAWQLAIDAARTGGSTSGGTSISRQVEVLSNRGMDEEEEKQEQLEIGPRVLLAPASPVETSSNPHYLMFLTQATVTTRRTCFCVLSTCKNVGKRRASVRGEYHLRTESYGFGSTP
ncbi:hypothetical protein Bbelb_382040 [Branchiostoma belcheri]|nr:hypothetical protein Bbelb_382040 [Branchiostoma belcheri]